MTQVLPKPCGNFQPELSSAALYSKPARGCGSCPYAAFTQLPSYKGRFFFLSFPFTCLTALKHKFLPRPTCSDQQGPDSKGFKALKPTKAGGAVWLCCSSRLQDVMTWDFKGVLCIRAGVLQPLGKSQCMCLLCLSLIALLNEFLVH